MRAAIELIPYEAPRLNAIAVAPMGALDKEEFEAQGAWEAEYQQSPIIVGGGIFPIEKIGTWPVWDGSGIKKSCRYWDKAGTTDGGAYTAGVLMHQMDDKRYTVSHIVRGQWGALEREQQIKRWAEIDKAALKHSYEVVIEQEPGSGGKESAENTIRNLAGFNCYADRVTSVRRASTEWECFCVCWTVGSGVLR